MRRVVTAAILLVAMAFGGITPALAQCTFSCARPSHDISVTGGAITPLGGVAMGAVFTAAAAPIIGTIVLGREMTPEEVYRSTLTSFLGPVGWWLGNQWFPDKVSVRNPPTKGPQGSGRNINIPPPGMLFLVPNEILVGFDSATSAAYLAEFARSLQLTELESQSFALTRRTLRRYRIDGTRSVANTLRALSRFGRVSTAQANLISQVQQGAPASTHAAAPDAAAAQYVVSKLHLLEAHKISSGDDVLVAVIDSQIDTGHPDLAGVIADEYDALGTPAPPHSHGTAMAGAIAAHAKLVGVAPKVKLLAVRAFTGKGESAQSTTFNILKGLDWAASKNARIVNMSFAGPADPMFRDMLAKANARGIVLIAAVGNAGPRSPPLYPAADSHVIGVTATDADDKLLPQANRGPQVAVAAPGVEILAPAPNGGYQVTSGTSVAAAHASGVAALLLARNPKLTPAQIRQALTQTAHKVASKRTETGAGVIDALGAVNSLGQ